MSDSAVAPGLEQIVVMGLGVRYMAESARRAGLRVTAVDAFADQDTAAAALAVRAAGATADDLTRAALRLGAPGTGLIYGGGMEGREDLLRALAQRMRLLGNRPPVAAMVADPRAFFSLLDGLRIPYPRVRLEAPEDPTGWLLKHGASCGGREVRLAAAPTSSAPGPDAYFQRRAAGPVVSVLFAADGTRARIIGYNRVFSESRGNRPYAYAGAATWNGPDACTRELVEGYIQRLTRAIGLKGINGLDLVFSDGRFLVLELNARPTATLELHEERLPEGGLAAHLAACAGRLPDPVPEDLGTVRAYRVIYADQPLVAPPLPWPAWVRDRPREGTRTHRHEPLCTVHAIGSSQADLKQRLETRARCLWSLIGRGGAQAA